MLAGVIQNHNTWARIRRPASYLTPKLTCGRIKQSERSEHSDNRPSGSAFVSWPARDARHVVTRPLLELRACAAGSATHARGAARVARRT
jgi:hypothetical protein